MIHRSWLDPETGRRLHVEVVLADDPERELFLASSYDVHGPKIQIIRHGIPSLPSSNQELLKARFGVAGRRMLLTFGLLSPNKGIAILPVGDRDKFLAATHGMRGSGTDKLDSDVTCMETHGVYACATDPTLFDRLGNGTLSAMPAGARGDIELAARGIRNARIAGSSAGSRTLTRLSPTPSVRAASA